MSAILKYLNYIGCYRILVAFLALWLIIVVMSALPMLGTNVTNSDTKVAERLTRALSDLEALRKQNEELREIFKDISVK